MIVEDSLKFRQASQIARQFAVLAACKASFTFPPIELGKDCWLFDLQVNPGVFWPMSSIRLAAFLYGRRDTLRGKSLIDMGSGTGLQGLVAALNGASNVILTDVTREAFENTYQNVSRLSVNSICDVRRGDLFENVPEMADIIVFAEPYFPGEPDARYPFTFGMVDKGDLIHRFLDQAKQHVRDRILMCHLDFAGDLNNPKVQAPKHGYRVVEHGPELITTGIQQGWFSIYELTQT